MPDFEPTRADIAPDAASLPSRPPTLESPLVVYSPPKGSSDPFDPSPLVALLGKPGRYESAVLVAVRHPVAVETVVSDWGPADADPKTHAIATPWIRADNGEVPAGKPYPLLLTELARRLGTGAQAPDGKELFRKPGETDFWHVPAEYAGKIHVYSAETPLTDPPQVAEVGKIIAYTSGGAWITAWDKGKFREIG